jgi:hypothetical protein
MSLRFFADHCTPMSVAKRLVNDGHEVLVLREHLPKNSADEVVIEKAQQLVQS